MHAFRDLETAAYCPRKLYYRRRDDDPESVPDAVADRRELAFEYERLLAEDSRLRGAPIAVTPTQYRSRLGAAKARLGDDWPALVDPADRDRLLEGRECRGRAHKLLTTSEGPTVSLLFTGRPPETGVWEPQSVRLVAAAKAPAWERERSIDRAFAEYPAHGVVRAVPLTTRRRAAYREAVAVADAIDGPPSRTTNRSKCEACEYSGRCGVRTRSLRSLLSGR